MVVNHCEIIKMAVRVFSIAQFTVLFSTAVLADSISDLKLQKALLSRSPIMTYKSGMKSLLMRDERGCPFEAILKSDTNFNLWLSSSIDEDVTFYLYTRDYNMAVQVYTNDSTGLSKTKFNSENPTVVLVHGFTNNVHSSSVQIIREAYLSAGEFNVFGVDWSNLAKGPWYNYAAQQTYTVGLKVAEFLDYLITSNVSLESLHVIGHSLGAHVAGISAKNVQAGKISRVTGLDPALPLFDEEHVTKRIDANDAGMVDCIHTCGGLLGFYTPICSHDFYPNGGSIAQPGCFFDIFGDCSHGRSYQYYAESIYDAFVAEKCVDINGVKNGNCANGTGVMGHHSPGSPSGIYYLSTNKQYPFNKH